MPDEWNLNFGILFYQPQVRRCEDREDGDGWYSLYNLRRIFQRQEVRLGSHDKGNEREGDIFISVIYLSTIIKGWSRKKVGNGIQQVPRKVVFSISSAYTRPSLTSLHKQIPFPLTRDGLRLTQIVPQGKFSLSFSTLLCLFPSENLETLRTFPISLSLPLPKVDRIGRPMSASFLFWANKLFFFRFQYLIYWSWI